VALTNLLSSVGGFWFEAKIFVEHSVGFSHDALHVLVGPCIQLLAAALLRRSLRNPWPWLVVLVLELANEANDLLIDHWPHPGEQWGESMKDLILTMTLPTLLLIIARYAPGLLGRAETGED
jgi:hypothetical protein